MFNDNNIKEQLEKTFSLHDVYDIMHLLSSFQRFQYDKDKDKDYDYDENDFDVFLSIYQFKWSIRKGAKE
tara:strand:+ start:52 stop:261 length:210 start_codon:yes stop_codon:yes gene_type:complete